VEPLRNQIAGEHVAGGRAGRGAAGVRVVDDRVIERIARGSRCPSCSGMLCLLASGAAEHVARRKRP
jgi:hypothetical protein